nr:RIO1 family regulatory kinase/ATPase [Nakamurella deserti]
MPTHGTHTKRHLQVVDPSVSSDDRPADLPDAPDPSDRDAAGPAPAGAAPYGPVGPWSDAAAAADDDDDDQDARGDWDDGDDDVSFQKFRSATAAGRRHVVVEGRSGRREVAAAEPVPVPDQDPRGGAAPPVTASTAYSTYDTAARGPEPVPGWVVTSYSAIDHPLGVLKTGKEADVHLLERGLPGGPSSLLAVKTYRSSEHRMFHRDAGYQEGRRTRRTREGRAMTTRTAFGRELLAGKWAAAEFAALSALWTAGAPVPYPVQLIGSELMMEFVGDGDGAAAPRLAAVPVPDHCEPVDWFTALWQDLVHSLELVASLGYTHGDLSPYNVLVADGRCVLIDLPQIVDVIANPQGPAFLARDASVIADFFARRGVPGADGDLLATRLADFAGL